MQEKAKAYLTITLDGELHERLKEIAKSQYRSVNSVVAQACDEFCVRHEAQKEIGASDNSIQDR